jgi:hypothetical protein
VNPVAAGSSRWKKHRDKMDQSGNGGVVQSGMNLDKLSAKRWVEVQLEMSVELRKRCSRICLRPVFAFAVLAFLGRISSFN